MSTPLHKYVIDFIHARWGSKEYFPGPQPISIEHKHFPILKGGDYMVCEKTDGERHMMVALTYEGKKKCLFLKKNILQMTFPNVVDTIRYQLLTLNY